MLPSSPVFIKSRNPRIGMSKMSLFAGLLFAEEKIPEFEILIRKKLPEIPTEFLPEGNFNFGSLFLEVREFLSVFSTILK